MEPTKQRPLAGVRERLTWLNTTDKAIVAALAALFLVGVLITAVSALERVTGTVCVTSLEMQGLSLGGTAKPDLALADGVSGASATVRLCSDSGLGSGQAVAALGAHVSVPLFLIVAVLLLIRFLWGATRPGPHSPVSPGRLRTLGLFVLIGGPASVAVEYLSRQHFVLSMLGQSAGYGSDDAVRDFGWAWWNQFEHDFPWWAVIIGSALLLMARLLRIAVRMGEELEGTI